MTRRTKARGKTRSLAARGKVRRKQARGKVRRKQARGKVRGKQARGVADLGEYAARRDFRRTPEPRGSSPASRHVQRRSGLRYVIQKHDASHLHYDFRLELDGVLKSWAVPKGPSLDPRDKRLAVHVEDHPLAYGSFEGVIPEHAYGGGTVLLWDEGTWTPEGEARAAYRKGHLSFVLHGRKLAGGWTLVRMAGRTSSRGKENWLLIKADDEHARRRGAITAERPESVASGRSLSVVARASGASERQQARATRADGKPPRAARTQPPLAAPPTFVAPELCTLVKQAPDGEGWLHEIKFDGFRMQGRIVGGKTTFLSRNRKPWTSKLPTLAAELARLPCTNALVDGEVILPTRGSGSDFEGFREAIGSAREARTVYQVFDLLHLDGEDLRDLPLAERKERLHELLARARRPRLRYTDHVTGRGERFLEAACGHELEGSIAKRADSPYRSGRGRDWLKVRCGKRQEFVLAGFTPSSTGGKALGSLILGVNDARGELKYAGRVGTGFSDAQRVQLAARLRRDRRAEPPLKAPRDPALREAVWVTPRLVGDVSFTEWTSAGRLRHPSFMGLRDDKRPDEVVRERPDEVVRERPVKEAATKAAVARHSADEVVIEGVPITHPDRVLFEEGGHTKADLARYVSQVAPLLLAHAAGRPLALLRCPEGQAGACFFQKHRLPGHDLTGVDVVTIRAKGAAAATDAMVVTSAAGLVSLVQHGALELHLWGSHIDDPERPDRLVFDLDPAPDVDFGAVMQAARDVRASLRSLHLTSFVMTTGGKGLHVVLPLRRRLEFDAVKEFAHAFSAQLARSEPERFVAQAGKSLRKGRIFIDYLRNGRGATAVCPYGVRARSGAPIAMPLRWTELRKGLAPDTFKLQGIARRLAAVRKRDPWRGYAATGRQSITQAARRAVGLTTH